MNDYHPYDYPDQFKTPWMAKLLHSLPHYNITFHKVNSTFRPNDYVYKEVSFSFFSSSIHSQILGFSVFFVESMQCCSQLFSLFILGALSALWDEKYFLLRYGLLGGIWHCSFLFEVIFVSLYFKVSKDLSLLFVQFH